jgi:ABC-type nitrate/sulfonate/bicarbonate transport system ATPase subunit
MSVLDNVAYGLVERGERDSELLRARVAEVLASVGMSGSEALMPSELSGGMKKRVRWRAPSAGSRDLALRRAHHRPRSDQRAAHQRADPWRCASSWA